MFLPVFLKILLKRHVAKYLATELDVAQLAVTLSKGSVELKDLLIDVDYINSLGLGPLEMTSGLIGCLRVTLYPPSLCIEDIVLRVRPRDPASLTKQCNVTREENHEPPGQEASIAGGVQALASWLMSCWQRMSIQVNNLLIKVEDVPESPGHAFNLSVAKAVGTSAADADVHGAHPGAFNVHVAKEVSFEGFLAELEDGNTGIATPILNGTGGQAGCSGDVTIHLSSSAADQQPHIKIAARVDSLHVSLYPDQVGPVVQLLSALQAQQVQQPGPPEMSEEVEGMQQRAEDEWLTQPAVGARSLIEGLLLPDCEHLAWLTFSERNAEPLTGQEELDEFYDARSFLGSMQESISSLMGDEESCTAHYMVESVTASVHQFKRVHTACYNFSLHLPAATVALGYTSLKEDASALVIHLTSFAAEISYKGRLDYSLSIGHIHMFEHLQATSMPEEDDLTIQQVADLLQVLPGPLVRCSVHSEPKTGPLASTVAKLTTLQESPLHRSQVKILPVLFCADQVATDGTGGVAVLIYGNRLTSQNTDGTCIHAKSMAFALQPIVACLSGGLFGRLSTWLSSLAGPDSDHSVVPETSRENVCPSDVRFDGALSQSCCNIFFSTISLIAAVPSKDTSMSALNPEKIAYITIELGVSATASKAMVGILRRYVPHLASARDAAERIEDSLVDRLQCSWGDEGAELILGGDACRLVACTISKDLCTCVEVISISKQCHEIPITFSISFKTMATSTQNDSAWRALVSNGEDMLHGGINISELQQNSLRTSAVAVKLAGACIVGEVSPAILASFASLCGTFTPKPGASTSEIDAPCSSSSFYLNTSISLCCSPGHYDVPDTFTLTAEAIDSWFLGGSLGNAIVMQANTVTIKQHGSLLLYDYSSGDQAQIEAFLISRKTPDVVHDLDGDKLVFRLHSSMLLANNLHGLAWLQQFATCFDMGLGDATPRPPFELGLHFKEIGLRIEPEGDSLEAAAAGIILLQRGAWKLNASSECPCLSLHGLALHVAEASARRGFWTACVKRSALEMHDSGYTLAVTEKELVLYRCAGVTHITTEHLQIEASIEKAHLTRKLLAQFFDVEDGGQHYAQQNANRPITQLPDVLKSSVYIQGGWKEVSEASYDGEVDSPPVLVALPSSCMSAAEARTVTVGGDGVYYESFELNNFVMEDYVELPPEDEWLDRPSGNLPAEYPPPSYTFLLEAKALDITLRTAENSFVTGIGYAMADVRLSLEAIRCQTDTFSADVDQAKRVTLSVFDIKGEDNVLLSPMPSKGQPSNWRLILGHDSKCPRDPSEPFLRMVADAVMSPKGELEWRARVSFLPVRLQLHQVSLILLRQYIAGLAADDKWEVLEQDEPEEEEAGPLVRKCLIESFSVRVKYQSDALSLASLASGNAMELLNLVPLSVILDFRQLKLYAFQGVPALIAAALTAWGDDVLRYQKHRLLAGVKPLKPFVRTVTVTRKAYREDGGLWGSTSEKDRQMSSKQKMMRAVLALTRLILREPS